MFAYDLSVVGLLENLPCNANSSVSLLGPPEITKNDTFPVHIEKYMLLYEIRYYLVAWYADFWFC